MKKVEMPIQWVIEPTLVPKKGYFGKFRRDMAWRSLKTEKRADRIICTQSAKKDGIEKLGTANWRMAQEFLSTNALKGTLHSSFPLLEIDWHGPDGRTTSIQYVFSDLASEPWVVSIVAVDPESDAELVPEEEVQPYFDILKKLGRTAAIQTIIEILKGGA